MKDFYTIRTVKWDKNRVFIIDQTKLPEKLIYIQCLDYKDIVKAIKNMLIRGAPAIGIAAAMGIVLAVNKSQAKNKKDLLKDIEKIEQELIEIRPTAVNLQWAVNRITKKIKMLKGSIKDIKKSLINEIRFMADEDVSKNLLIGKNGTSLLNNGETVLTHCK
jgi:methylthioribose-1-phosphate isomerase